LVRFVEIEAKSILRRYKFRDDWFWNRYGINAYRGCQFACNYCDAITEKYLVHEDYRDFSRTIYVKKNAPRLLEEEIKRAKPDVVCMSGVTDPYQPAERKYKLTRRILEILAEHKFPVHIVTKSDLVLRDIDLLKRIGKETWCAVSLTIITFNEKLLPYLEPFAPPPERRLKVVEKLNEEGIMSGVDFTPIVPYLLDEDENIEEVIKKASWCAEYILIGAEMTLRSNQRLRFFKLLEENFPELLEKYKRLYGEKESPPQDYVLRLNKKAFDFCKRYGIRNYIPPPSFERRYRENFDVANHLLLIAFFKEFKSANPYSAWAYHRASEQIEHLDESIRKIYERRELEKIPWVGRKIAEIIEEFLVHGKTERLKKEMNAW